MEAKPPSKKPVEERRGDENNSDPRVMATAAAPSVALVEEEEALLGEHHHINLLRSASNATSQVAIVGSHVCPIESLDYKLFENDFFKQDWRSRDRAHIIRYVVPLLPHRRPRRRVVFFNDLSVKNITGVKFVGTSNLMLAKK